MLLSLFVHEDGFQRLHPGFYFGGTHYLSLRWQQKFATLNCALLSPTLLESELFGHKVGSFKPDLLDRLSFEVVHLPPLRERGEDIMLLATHFAMQMAVELGLKDIPGFSPSVTRRLSVYPNFVKTRLPRRPHRPIPPYR